MIQLHWKIAFGNLHSQTQSPTPIQTEIPHTIARRLIEAKLHNAVLVWTNGLQPDGLTRRTYDGGIQQLESYLEIIFVQNETHISDVDIEPFQHVQRSGRGRPRRVYAFKPDALDRLEAFFMGRARAERYKNTPSNVQPDFADPPLAERAVVALDAARKDAYAAHADQRQIAEMERVRNYDYIEADFRRIREGRYMVFDMPDGCRSAADLRRALYERKLDDNPEGIESYKLRKTAGISRATQSRYRQQYHTITIPQHVDIPVSSVDDVVLGPRQTGELIAPDGTAIFIAGDTVGDDVGAFVADHLGVILRKSKPSMEKRSDAANEDEHNAYKRYSAQQRRRAGKGDQTGRDKPQRVTLRPSGYSQKWLERQLMYTPGVGDVPRYDPNTGEVFTAAQRWHMLGEGVMSTFTAHSEPREPEIPVTDPPIQPVEPEKPIKRAATPPWCRPALRPDIEVAPIDFQAIDDLCAMYRGAA